MSEPTHITELVAENVMRLEAVSITPDPQGNLIVIGGRNGAGKTSVLNSIAMALGGRKLCPKQPIKSGETRASVTVTLDNGLVVERRFTENGDYLHVSDGKGQKVSRPQEILDRLTGTLTFDPLAFARMSADERTRVLRDIVQVDVDGFEKEREAVYEERRDLNRSLRDAEGALKDMPESDTHVPDKEVSIAELSAELERRQTHNAEVQKLVNACEHAQRALDIWTAQRDEAEQQVKQREAELQDAKERLAAGDRHIEEGRQNLAEAKTAAGGGKYADTSAVRIQIEQADETNRAVRAKKARAAQTAKVKELQKASDDLTKRIDRLDSKKAQALAEAKYPIDGLAITPASAVVYKGVPFEQASQSEQLRVSLAIGLALNPTLRVMLIRDGSLLDKDGLAEVARIAAGADAQVWLERVGEGQDCSVVIEEGRVKP